MAEKSGSWLKKGGYQAGSKPASALKPPPKKK
jgi:hypothetical protein